MATGPGELAAARAAAAPAMPFDRAAYGTITTIPALDRVIAAAYDAGRVAIDTETSSLDAMQAS